ncbi:MAG: Gfo/Idh/MocA family oxidoreductase [Eubacteriales bacterium]
MKVGIIGAGQIASKMARTLGRMEDATCYGIASRSLEKAQTFADAYGVEKAYGSYEELVQDEEIELVYIATPHVFHLEHAKLAMQHGKSVLCEKPFMVNAEQAREAIACAKENNVLIAEAIWTRYMPSRRMVDEIIASNKIGEVKSLTANLGYDMATKKRILDPELAGGALLDVGVYAINFAAMILGLDIEEIQSVCVKGETGVDMQNSMIFKYKSGAVASLQSSALASTEQYGIVYGTKGYLIAKNINNVDVIEVYNPNCELLESHAVPEQITGFEDQVRACMKAIKEGKKECSEMPYDEILKIMEIMDGLRKDWDLVYPFEK